MSMSLTTSFLVCIFFAIGETNTYSTASLSSTAAHTTEKLLQTDSSTATTLPPVVNKLSQNVTQANATEGQLTLINLQSIFGRTVIGDSCKSTDDCKIKESFCINGTCECSTEYVASSNKRFCLIKARSLLDTCIENIQCEVGLNATGLTSCIGFKCICDFDASLVEGKCYKRLELGASCQQNAECSVPYSTCIQNVCACDSNMEPDPDNRRCIVMKSIDAPTTNCTDDYMCSKFGELYYCRNGTCGCKPGYHFSEKKCVPELRLGDPCEKSTDCLIETEVEITGLRECKENKCVCIPNYKTDIRANLCKSGGSLLSSSLLLLCISWFIKLLLKT